MGRTARLRPKRLAEKLKSIRLALGFSQTEMIKALELDDKGYRHYISNFETGHSEPPLPVLLNYARLAGVYMDSLVDDEIDLPKRLPAKERTRATN